MTELNEELIPIDAALADVWLALAKVQDEGDLALCVAVARAAFLVGQHTTDDEIERLRDAVANGYRGASLALPVADGILTAGAS